jgi:hypothetical protein
MMTTFYHFQVCLLSVLTSMGVEGLKNHAINVADFYRKQRDACIAAAEKHLTGTIKNKLKGFTSADKAMDHYDGLRDTYIFKCRILQSCVQQTHNRLLYFWHCFLVC